MPQLVCSWPSGGAYAPGQITGGQIKDGTITGADVKNRSLSAADFKGSLTGSPGPPGAQGPAGAVGPVGPAGPSVTARLKRVQSTVALAAYSQAGFVGGAAATCASGERVVSGGYVNDVTVGEVFGNAASADGSSWLVLAANYGDIAALTAFAYCAPTGVAVSSSAASRHRAAEREIARMVQDAHKHR